MKRGKEGLDPFRTWILLLSFTWGFLFIILPVFSTKPPSSSALSTSTTCLDKNKASEEEFVMRMNLCRRNIAISCEIGGKAECHKDREAFRATAVVSKSLTECLIEANTTELKYIRYVIKAKFLRNLNEMGSRGLGDLEPEVQRGKCTLGYTCINHQYLKDIRVNCIAFHYDRNENPYNETKKKFHWDAPKFYQGPVIFTATVHVSYTSFYVDADTAKITIPKLASTSNFWITKNKDEKPSPNFE